MSKKSSSAVKTSSGVKFVITQAARPSAGTRLASYTEAWLQLTGLADGGSIPAAQAKEIMGDTAYGYHTRKGNFEKTADGFKLTAQGESHFGIGTNNRLIRPEPEMVKAYTETMSKGSTNEQVKNPGFIKPINKV